MPKISEKFKKKFNPYFVAVLNGKSINLTIGEMENHPEKYAHTHLVDMYEDADNLKKRLKKTKKQSARKLNMEKGSIGLVFEEGYVNPYQQAVDSFLDSSKRKHAKLKAKVEAKEKLEDSTTESKTTTKKSNTKKTKAKTDAEKAADAVVAEVEKNK